MSNNSNFNYLQTIPNEPSPTPSYQPAQQQFLPQQQLQVMGPNGQMINRPELEQAIVKFLTNPKYKFDVIRQYLPIKLEQHYKKYFDVLETIKLRRGQEEYLSDLRRLLNKMNDYITKTEQTIIKLKKTLDYTESTLPIQYQFQPTINGAPPTQNTFMIHELQNVIEKDNNIEFVDIFGLKGKNIAHIDPADRITILIIVQSLMGFNPSLNPLENHKLMHCLKSLQGQISDYSSDKVEDTDKLNINIDDASFKPLVQIDIYSKLFDVFDKGSINIKDLKTDKISERINSPSNKSPSPSSQSPYGFLRGGDFESFGSPRRNNRKENNKRKGNNRGSKPEHNIQAKIKKITKYEIGSTTNSGNINFELERTVRKKGIELTEYLFYNTNIIEELNNITIDKKINNTQIQSSGGKGQRQGQGQGQRQGQGQGQRQGQREEEPKELNGNTIIKILKDSDNKYNDVRTELRNSNISKYCEKLKAAYALKRTKKLLETQKQKYLDERKPYTKELELLIELEKVKKHVLNSDQTERKKELEQKISDINQKINPGSKYTDAEIEKVVIELNLYLKNMIEKYKTRILFRAEENFGNQQCSIIDFFTGTKDISKISNSYTKNKKNDETKSITFIQMYMMMYEAYRDYYTKYSIETIIKSFSKDTIKKDNQTKLNILNGLGLYSAIVYNKIKQVRDIIKSILQQSNPDFEKAKGMLLKVQTLINSSPDEEKKEKLLKMKKNIEEQINKLAENKKNNRGQNRKNTSGNTKPWEKDKGENKKPWEKKPWEKDKDKFGEKKYKKSYNNNNVSL